MSIDLSVNLNKIALIRNSRPGDFPNVLRYGEQCLAGGVQGLTAHPRPDQRHIRPDDVRQLASLVKNTPGTEFNVEGNPFAPTIGDYPGLLPLVEETRPHQCTLVPDSNTQMTSDHGFNLVEEGDRVAPIIAQLRQWGIRVSLFMDPDLEQIALAKKLGADRIELYTGPFADAYAQQSPDLQDLYESYVKAAEFAHSVGLGVNAGHDLNLHNMQLFRNLPALQEVSIGHALTVDALQMGLDNAIQAYLKICSK